MAQIVFPNDFLSQLTLLDDVIAKNTEEGAKSPILAWMKEKKMELSAFKTVAGKAQACETQRLSYDSLSQTAYQERDKLFTPVFSFVMQGAQALKKWYKPTYAALKDWGIPITASGRIDYPSSFEDKSAIAEVFFTKYNSYGEGESPLAAFVTVNEVDVPELEKNLADAMKNNTSGTANAKLAESATAQRNIYWAPATAGLRAIGDYLKGIYVKNPRVLGEWGFVVDEGEKKPTLRKSKFIIGETKVLTGIKVGSVLMNTGKGSVTVWKRDKKEGDNNTLLPGEKMGLVSGYSTMTVENLSTLETAEISIAMPD